MAERTSMEIENEEPPCAGQWFSFWIVGAKGRTKIEARVDAKRIHAAECPDHPCHELIQIPESRENRTLRISARDSAGTTCEKKLTIQAGKPRPELTALGPDNVQAADLARLPTMTGWFTPLLLAKLLLKVIISDVFGQYADRRLISAALDRVSAKGLRLRTDISGLVKDKTGAVWFDYVSDLGDGFDATYAIAYLLAQPELQVKGCDYPLPRGKLVVMGGDQVYPTATRDDYTVKMRLPYSLALPDQGGKSHPLILLIPGNHDWYDGLVSFLASFCRNDPTAIGDWQTRQQRSYFAAKVSDNWWIWGIDIALVRDMDQPQADYFVAIAKAMPQGANIILCSAEPGWYKAAEESSSFRTLTYVSRIAEHAKDEHGNKKNLRIPLVLSGDSHHYARYVGGGAQYITSGGGGAFLAGTLELKPEIQARWLIEEHDDEPVTLKLCPTCYPTRAESERLIDGNRQFGARNPGLTWAWASLYLAYSFALTSLHTAALNWDVVLIEFLILAGGVWGYARYQERYSSLKIIAAAAAHAFAHMAVIVGISVLALGMNKWVLSPILTRLHLHWHWLFWLAYLGAFAFTLGRWAAGHIFGLYLLITCRKLDMNHRDAFSAMRLDSHRHFLRIRILGDTVTVFPIKLDKVPGRKGWRYNPKDERNRSPSVFSPAVAMEPELIEEPIEIRVDHESTATSQVKVPGELPPDAK
jgi:hypothetical protein